MSLPNTRANARLTKKMKVDDESKEDLKKRLGELVKTVADLEEQVQERDAKLMLKNRVSEEISKKIGELKEKLGQKIEKLGQEKLGQVDLEIFKRTLLDIEKKHEDEESF